MRAAKRVRRLSCGRWGADDPDGRCVSFPTEALARDYAAAAWEGHGGTVRWREVVALTLTGVTVASAGAGWLMNALMESHPSMAPIATISGLLVLGVRAGMHMKG